MTRLGGYFLGGIYIFFSESNDALNCFFAFLIAFGFLLASREISPFIEQSNNTLAFVAQLVIMLVFLGGFILASSPFEFDPSVWGWLLFLFAIFAAALAIWFQYKYGSAQLELQASHAPFAAMCAHTCSHHVTAPMPSMRGFRLMRCVFGCAWCSCAGPRSSSSWSTSSETPS